MQHNRPTSITNLAAQTSPDNVSARELFQEQRRLSLPSGNLRTVGDAGLGRVRATVLSFQNMHLHGDLLVNFLKARRNTFIDRLQWRLSVSDGMEYDQYDTPACRWVVIHEFDEVIGGIRISPTTARCGMYSYMLRDAQRGLLEEIPTDVLYFEAPVSDTIWEASRLFVSQDVPSARRSTVQSILMRALGTAAQNMGALQVIGIVPAVWSRWLRRLDLDAVPVGPTFVVDGTVSQAALFNTTRNRI